MSSINTNTAAMTALQTLQQTNSMMEQTQTRISTGKRVNTAADNAAYWSIAKTMSSDNNALSTVKDALGLGAAKLDVAYTALESVTDIVGQIKDKLVAAREPGVDRATVQADVDELQNQLLSMVNSASFSGENWLSADDTDNKTIVSSFVRNGDGTATMGTIAIDRTDMQLLNSDGSSGSLATVFAIDVSAADDAAVEAAIDTAIGSEESLIATAGDVGSARARVNLQNDFVSNLMDAIDRGVGQLVDADMTEESSKLKALQVQQQLGIQSLSIANSNAQNILSLFR